MSETFNRKRQRLVQMDGTNEWAIVPRLGNNRAVAILALSPSGELLLSRTHLIWTHVLVEHETTTRRSGSHWLEATCGADGEIKLQPHTLPSTNPECNRLRAKILRETSVLTRGRNRQTPFATVVRIPAEAPPVQLTYAVDTRWHFDLYPPLGLRTDTLIALADADLSTEDGVASVRKAARANVSGTLARRWPLNQSLKPWQHSFPLPAYDVPRTEEHPEVTYSADGYGAHNMWFERQGMARQALHFMFDDMKRLPHGPGKLNYWNDILKVYHENVANCQESIDKSCRGVRKALLGVDDKIGRPKVVMHIFPSTGLKTILLYAQKALGVPLTEYQTQVLTAAYEDVQKQTAERSEFIGSALYKPALAAAGITDGDPDMTPVPFSTKDEAVRALYVAQVTGRGYSPQPPRSRLLCGIGDDRNVRNALATLAEAVGLDLAWYVHGNTGGSMRLNATHRASAVYLRTVTAEQIQEQVKQLALRDARLINQFTRPEWMTEDNNNQRGLARLARIQKEIDELKFCWADGGE